MGGRGGASWSTNMEAPYGSTLISNYAMVKQRHMHQYGTTNEQLAEISVATRKHAMRNPEAVKAMTDLQFVKVDNITVADVLESRIVANPLRLLECCMVSDGGGALVIVSADVAKGIKKKPVWVLGSGEATKYRENGGDITTSAGAMSGPAAFGQAGVTPAEIDIAMIYDSFTITVATCLEDLGFCKKGEVGAFIGDGHLAFDKPGLTINTDGGGLLRTTRACEGSSSCSKQPASCAANPPPRSTARSSRSLTGTVASSAAPTPVAPSSSRPTRKDHFDNGKSTPTAFPRAGHQALLGRCPGWRTPLPDLQRLQVGQLLSNGPLPEVRLAKP